MRVSALGLAMAAALLAAPVSAATLVDQFTFDSGLGADIGTATASGAGAVTGGRYAFDPNEGLSVTLDSTLSHWSIVLYGQISETSSWRRLLDFSGLGSDVGLYSLDGYLQYYPVAVGAAATITSSVDFMLALTFDGTHTRGYVNGAEQFDFQQSGAAYPSSLTSFVAFQDDAGEASAGSMDFLQVYDDALTGQQVAAITGPSTVPLPAGLPLLLAGLGSIAILRRRKV